MIIKYFDAIYTKLTSNYHEGKDIYIRRALAFIFRLFVNVYLPFHYKFICNIAKVNSDNTRQRNNEIVVSLTSFKARINKTYLCIETILRQTVIPYKVILYLSKEEFNDTKALPVKLVNLMNYGLSIEFVDGNIKSHKKYIYSFTKFKDKKIVLFDDDILYPEIILQNLIDHSNKYPNSVCATRARNINYIKGTEYDYLNWRLVEKECPPNPMLFATSGAGTLYPVFIKNNFLLDPNLAISLAPTADDIWIHMLTRASNIYVTKTEYGSSLLQIFYLNNISLHQINIGELQNNEQLIKVEKFFKERFGGSMFA